MQIMALAPARQSGVQPKMTASLLTHPGAIMVGTEEQEARMTRGTVMLVILGLSTCWTPSAWATNDGRADPDLLIGALETYLSAQTAQRACRDDKVVWADRYTGFYYESNEAKYGATEDGNYACESNAKKAHYWSTDPRGSMDGHPGRTFPFDPIYYGS